MGGASSLPKVSAQDKAILDMKTKRDKLHQYQERITVITDRETTIARTCLVRGQKEKALLALRRKKFQESLLAKTDAQLETLERLTADVEFALVQQDVIYGIRQGTAVLQRIHAEMGSLSSVEKLMGETQDAQEYQAEISQMLRGEMSREDEDEVEAELEQMNSKLSIEASGPSEQEIRRPTQEVMPEVPQNQLQGPQGQRDEEAVAPQESRQALMA